MERRRIRRRERERRGSAMRTMPSNRDGRIFVTAIGVYLVVGVPASHYPGVERWGGPADVRLPGAPPPPARDVPLRSGDSGEVIPCHPRLLSDPREELHVTLVQTARESKLDAEIGRLTRSRADRPSP